MKTIKRCSLLFFVVAVIFVLAACGTKAEPVVTVPAETVNPEPSVVRTPEPTPVPVVETAPVVEDKELTPAERAAEKGLPVPPDVDVTSWEFLVANSYNSILIYAPPYAGFEGQGIDERIFEVTCQMMADLRAEGLPAYMASIFRNYEFQTSHYTYKVNELGDAYEASKVIHGFGCSDHQTGLAFDITANPYMAINYSIFDNSEVLETETYQWMLDHCTDYGFILRYPEGKEQYYGTACTAGHFRYVGVEAAKYITENNLCLEEFLLLYDEDIIHVPGIN